MDGSDVVKLVLLLVALLFSAFFSGSEAAFLSLDRGKAARLQKSGVKHADRVARLANQPEKLFPTVLTGNNLVNTAAAALGTTIAASFLSSNKAVIASTLVVTILLLIFAEVIPKTIAAKNPERFALTAVAPLRLVETLLFPAVWALERLTGAVGRLFGVSGTAMVAEQEIRALVDLSRDEGGLEHAEADLVERVFRFGDRQLREIMTPRTEIVWIEKGTTLEGFLQTYQQHSHTRFPIFEGDVDNVTGTLSVKDIVRAIAGNQLCANDDATQLVRPAYFVPETKLVGQLFAELRQSGYQMVMVADEFGGVAGLVTLKRMAEEVVGRVGEEGGEEDLEFQVIDAHTYQVDGGMHIDEANEHMGMDIPEGNYETIAGFLLAGLGHIPQQGERMHHQGFLIEVSEMRGVKIEQLKVTRVSKPVAGETE